MKIKLTTLFLILFFAFGTLALTPSKSNAAFVWATCTIDKITQPNTYQVAVFLTETSATPVFTAKYFKIDNAKQKEQLAILLTAMSMDLTIQVRFDDTTDVITHITVINE